jgi:carbon monoxide dehydrogenase subunit G
MPMQLEHSFTVPVPVGTAWATLLDLPRIAPCMPGATLTGVEGDTFTGTVKVKLGPIALTYQGKGRFVERDEAAHRVVIEASGKDTRSAGTAAATVTAALTADGDKTRVDVTTDLSITGKPAQFGRGMIADVSAKLIGQFADCVATTLTAGAGPAAPEKAESAGPAEPSTGSAEPATGSAEPATGSAEPSIGPAEAAGSAEAATGPSPAAQAAADAATASAAAELTSTASATAAAERAPAATTSAEAEPIDLLKLTGSTATARRLAGYGVGAALFAVLAWLVIRWLRS